MKGKCIIVTLIISLILGASSMALASQGYLTQFINTPAYAGTAGSRLDTCLLCHTTSDPRISGDSTRNPFGTDFASATMPMHMDHMFDGALNAADSDGDGFANLAEINARTFPGNNADKPASGDLTKPTVNSFTVASPSTSLTVNISTFTATDNVKVTGYMVTKNNLTPPLPSAMKWTASPPTTFTFPSTTTPGLKTLYAWAKDQAGNVSNPFSAQVTLNIPPPDLTKPTVTGFTVASPSTSRTVTISTFTATDNVGGSGVTGYMVTKNNMTMPLPTSAKWSATPPTTFTFPATATSGVKTLYAWAKDQAGNVSKALSAQVTLNLPGPDITKPTVTGFTVASPSTSLTVTISTFTATDNIGGSGVTGYMVTKNNMTMPLPTSAKWSATPPTTFTFPATATSGVKTLYAWVKDQAGNVSKALSAQVTLNLGAVAPAAPAQATAGQKAQTTAAPVVLSNSTTSGAPQTPMADAAADLTVWVGKWFKINLKNEGFYTGKAGMSNDRQSIPGYLKIWGWDAVNKILQADFYQTDLQTGQWSSQTVSLHYVSGSDLDFEFWSQVTGDFAYGFTARVRGTEVNGVLESATFKTIGGYHIQKSNQPDASQQWAGWLVITGKMVPESEVQVPADILQH